MLKVLLYKRVVPYIFLDERVEFVVNIIYSQLEYRCDGRLVQC